MNADRFVLRVSDLIRAQALQRAPLGARAAELSPAAAGVSHTPGRPLDAGTRAHLEPLFRHDLSRVRVHTDPEAAEVARAVGAAAYTIGSDITFAAGHYRPSQPAGRRLLAHELVHVVQQQRAVPTPANPLTSPLPDQGPQSEAKRSGGGGHNAAEREADRVSEAVERDRPAPDVVERPGPDLARAPLDLNSISADSQGSGWQFIQTGMISIPMPWLWIKYAGHASGEVTKAADYPTTFKIPADKTKNVAVPPKPDAKPPLSNIPVMAHFFPATIPGKGRALVIGGFHADEKPGWQVTDALVDELAKVGAPWLAFHTIVVPRLNAAAIEDELAGVHLWRNRCNRQVVDLNRNFPTGKKAGDKGCPNSDTAPIQPEVQAVMDIVNTFKPDRIVSTHAISDKDKAGVFADPNQDAQAIELARGMASTIVNPSDRPANRLGPGPKDFNPVYPGDKPGVVSAGRSLGAWAPGAIPGKTTPVITMEAPEFGPLAGGKGSDPRTVEGFVRPLRAFLGDPKDLATAPDRDILADIDAWTAADRVAFLTGRLPSTNDIYRRIQLRVKTAVASLNAMSPPKTITILSPLRLFAEDIGANQAQAKIDFEKFFLVGDKAKGWDTLPDQFFKNGKRAQGVDRAKWQATPSLEKLKIIIRFSSLPGTSRHHWGTEVDLNSTTNRDWEPPSPGKAAGTLFALGQWLQANAPKAGLLQSYTAGRSGGYQEEPWHYSYAPISLGLRERYNAQVNLQTDVIDKIVAEFGVRAKAAGQTVPTDLAAALKQINISDLVNNIGPGL